VGFPVAASVASNGARDATTFRVPANEDAGGAIALYCDLISRAASDGISRGRGSSGHDIGAAAEPMPEELPPAETGSPTGEAFELLTAPRGAPDDLSRLSGMGPQHEKNLNDAGIFHYWQVAAMSPEDVAKVDQLAKLGGRIDREGWVQQARTFLENA
ncbi:hypothetical protein WDZ92_51715, partial [Nostoc sp. NIES-2111]